MSLNPKNSNILIPELVIERVLTQSLIFLKKDFKENTIEQNTYLYKLTNLVGVQRLSFFEQSKKLFLAEADDPKRINISLGFPDLVKNAVSIAIINAGSQHSENVLSVDQRNIDDEFITDENSSYYSGDGLGSQNINESNKWRENFGRYYNSNYQLIITSDNYNETLILFHVIKSMLIAFEGTGHFNFLGFMNLKINDSDIQIKNQQALKKFQKNIQLNFMYEYRVPGVKAFNFANGIIFKGIMKDLDDLNTVSTIL